MKKLLSLKNEEEKEIITSLPIFNDLSLREKIEIGVSQAFDYMKDFEAFEIVEIGPIFEVSASDHATYPSDDYELVGLGIKYKTEFTKGKTRVGFFPIYVGGYSLSMPLMFDTGYGPAEDEFNIRSFDSGYGDIADVINTLNSREEVNELIKTEL